jgi:hypothetical protein
MAELSGRKIAFLVAQEGVEDSDRSSRGIDGSE